jgi:hypothetical protein
MDQPQKHWIQAILGEDPYAALPAFYDVASWSNPLLMGVGALWTGDQLNPRATKVTGPEGGVVNPSKALSYVYPLDSEAAARLTFDLLNRSVPVRRDMTSGVVSLPAVSAPKDLAGLARSLDVTVSGSRSPAQGTVLRRPDVGILSEPKDYIAGTGTGEARYVVQQRWGLSPTTVSTDDINTNAAAFTGRHILVVPGGLGRTANINDAGLANLRAWVAAGGIWVAAGYYGLFEAQRAGLTTAAPRRPQSFTNFGTSYRINVDTTDPVGLGRPSEDFAFNDGFLLTAPSTTGANVATYPAGNTFWHNGYALGEDELKGTAAVVDEISGKGRAVLFSFDPFFRGYVESSMQMAANALLIPPATGTAPVRSGHTAASAVQPAGAGAFARPFSIVVKAADRDRTLAVVNRYTTAVTVDNGAGNVGVRIANPDMLSIEEHPFLRRVITDLAAAGIVPIVVGG